MRCTECGYQNEGGVQACVKCGTKLSGGATQPSPSSPVSNGGNPTVKGNIASQPAWDSASVSNQNRDQGSQFHRCPDCGHYPLKEPVSVNSPCPNCQAPGAAAKPNPGNEMPSSPKGEPSANKTVRLSDVDFGAKSPSITLTDVRDNSEIKFEGDSAQLNRRNLDPDNDSISSNHASLKFKNGQWHIQDNSSNNATFVQADGEVPLKDGINIIIGNKIYKVSYDS